MNSDQLKGKWQQTKGAVKERWGKLTNDDIDVIDGQLEQLVGTIQERYGIAREEAEKQVKEWNATGKFDVDDYDDDERVDFEKRKAS